MRSLKRSFRSVDLAALAGIVFAISSTATAAMPWARLGSARARVEFLASSHRAIPRLLNRRTPFDRDVLDLLAQQNSVRAEVQGADAYPRLLAARPEPLYFDVDVDNARIESESISPAALAEWRRDLLSTFDRLALDRAGDLPSSRREFAHAIGNEVHKIILAAATSPIRAYEEEKALALAELSVLALHDANSEQDPGQAGFRAWIANLGEGDLDLLREAEVVHRGLSGAGLDAATSEGLARELRAHVAGISNRRVTSVSAFTGRLTIEDAPADIATLRGFFGDDCATAYSFAYPDSPLERTFFIFDEHGAPLAYAAGTHIQFEGRPAFYLHTINGPGISAVQVDEVLRAFDFLKSRLGAESVVLPIGGRIDENMNYQQIKGAYHAAIAGGREGAITYRDSDVRSILNATTEAEYDRETKNTRGVEYRPGARANAEAKATVLEGSYDQARSMKAYAPIADIDVLMLAYGLEQSGRAVAASRVLEIENISPGRFAKLKRLLENADRLKTSAYETAVREALGAVKSVGGRDPLQDYASYFARGKFLAPDALDAAHAPATIAGTMDLIRAGEISAAAAVIAGRPGAFAESAEFRALVAGLPTSACPPLWRAGLDPSLFPAQIAELKNRLSSRAWWEAAESASELSLFATPESELVGTIVKAMQNAADPRARSRMALALLKSDGLDYMSRKITNSALAHSIADSRLSPEEMVRAVALVDMNVPRGTPWALARAMRGVANNPDAPEIWRARAGALANRWEGNQCTDDLHKKETWDKN